jgi:ATP adenylyltransferase
VALNPEVSEVPVSDEAPGLAHLWAGWRSEGFVGSKSGMTPVDPPGCVFCRIAHSAQNAKAPQALILHCDKGIQVVMNLYPYTSGHLMVMPTRHVGTLDELTAEESDELWRVIRYADSVVRQTYKPDGTNIGMNQGRGSGASIPDHLHVHVVPRWVSDTNFMTAIADTRVMIETVHRSYERLAANWGS